MSLFYSWILENVIDKENQINSDIISFSKFLESLSNYISDSIRDGIQIGCAEDMMLAIAFVEYLNSAVEQMVKQDVMDDAFGEYLP